MTSKLRFTSRGKAAGLIGASLMALGIGTGDALMGIAGAFVPFAMAADLVALKRRAAGVAEAEVKMGARAEDEAEEPEVSGAARAGDNLRGANARIIAGQRFSASGILKVKHRISTLRARVPFKVSFAQSRGSGRSGLKAYSVSLEAQPKTFGRYSVGQLEAGMVSTLGLYASEVPVKLDGDVGIMAFPRFYPELVRALGLLEGGLAGACPISQGMRARVARRGEEYAWTREYVPGDPDRFIDWKATARRARLCVKEFREEQGGGAMVFFDGRAPGAVSADELARDLLSICVGLAEDGMAATFISSRTGGAGNRDGDGNSNSYGCGTFFVDRAGPGELLRIAVAKALEMTSSTGGGWEGGAYSLMPPKIRSAVMALMNEKGYGNVEAGKDAYAEAMRRAREAPVSLAYVGCPLYEPERALAMVDAAAGARGGGAFVLMPELPWLDAGTVEQAYEMRESYLRIAGKIKATVVSWFLNEPKNMIAYTGPKSLGAVSD